MTPGVHDRPLVIVVAVAENGVIGHDNRLLWHLRSDLRRFKELTWGKPMIMGRKTFDSIGKALPGRETVVLTRSSGVLPAGVHVAHSFEEAVVAAQDLARTMGAQDIVVAGGADVYALALPKAQRIHLTRVHASPCGDRVFPPFDRRAFRELRRQEYPQGPNDEHAFTTIDLERRAVPRRARHDAGR